MAAWSKQRIKCGVNCIPARPWKEAGVKGVRGGSGATSYSEWRTENRQRCFFFMASAGGDPEFLHFNCSGEKINIKTRVWVLFGFCLISISTKEPIRDQPMIWQVQQTLEINSDGSDRTGALILKEEQQDSKINLRFIWRCSVLKTSHHAAGFNQSRFLPVSQPFHKYPSQLLVPTSSLRDSLRNETFASQRAASESEIRWKPLDDEAAGWNTRSDFKQLQEADLTPLWSGSGSSARLWWRSGKNSSWMIWAQSGKNLWCFLEAAGSQEWTFKGWTAASLRICSRNQEVHW